MSYLFDHPHARAQWKYRGLALKKKFPPGCSAFGKCVPKPIANLTVTCVHFQLPNAIAKNKRTGVRQLSL